MVVNLGISLNVDIPERGPEVTDIQATEECHCLFNQLQDALPVVIIREQPHQRFVPMNRGGALGHGFGGCGKVPVFFAPV